MSESKSLNQMAASMITNGSVSANNPEQRDYSGRNPTVAVNLSSGADTRWYGRVVAVAEDRSSAVTDTLGKVARVSFADGQKMPPEVQPGVAGTFVGVRGEQPRFEPSRSKNVEAQVER